MDEASIEKNKDLIKEISNLNKMRQYRLVEDIDEILKDLKE